MRAALLEVLETVEPLTVPPARPSSETDQPALVTALADIEPDQLADVGGKALNLAELVRGGYRVPPGFCVTTSAYHRVTDHPTCDAPSTTSPPPRPTTPSACPASPRRSTGSSSSPPCPTTSPTTVTAAYRQMGQAIPVAVRSSATAEDLPFASFAGQQDTFLGVVGETSLLEAVRRCWASLWTVRAVSYRAGQGIDPHTVRLAVVVQQLVDAEVAGVLFTADPVTGRRRHAVIDAGPGLGEAVVSGAVNPDHFVVDTATGTVLERRPGDKRVAIRPRPGGGTTRTESHGAGPPAVPHRRAAARAGRARATGSSGTSGGRRTSSGRSTPRACPGSRRPARSRPSTPLPANAPAPGADRRVYFCLSVAQGLNRPITPMGLASFRLLGSAMAQRLGEPVADRRAGPRLYADPGQRLFADLTDVLRSRVGRSLMPRVLDFMEARSAVILRSLLDAPDLTLTRRSRLPFARRVLRLTVPYGVPLQVLQALVSPAATHRRLARLEDAQRRRVRTPPGLDAHQRLDWAEDLLSEDVVPLLPRMMPAAATGLAMLALAVRLLGADATGTETAAVLRGLPHNVTTEMDLALWRLARRVRADADAAETLRGTPPGQLAHSLPRRGAAGDAAAGPRGVPAPVRAPRGGGDRPGRPALGRRPDLRARRPRQLPAPRRPGTRPRRGVRPRRRARPRRRSGRSPRGHGGTVRRAARWSCVSRCAAAASSPESGSCPSPASSGRWPPPGPRSPLPVRSSPISGASTPPTTSSTSTSPRRTRPWTAPTCAGSWRAARRPTARSCAAAGCRACCSRTGPNPRPQQRSRAATAGSCAARPASAGVVTGVARVVLDPVGARLDPGELLVAPSTDPGWTPLFLTAGGLVMEMGGANSHGAVVAREYGIPAVVGVPGATEAIATGDRITIDGAAGSVTVETD